ncbi:MAG: PDZ domain-containing protein, partial [Planctomycetota bacterium]
TGKLPPPPPPPPGPPDENPKGRIPATPIADLLVVQFVQVDTSRPELSKALIKYTDQALSKLYDGEEQWLYAGDALGGVHKLWTVSEIRPNEVVFTRLLDDGEPDEEEDDQVARPPTAFDGDTLIVDATDGGAVVPDRDGDYFPPLGDDQYVGRGRDRTQEVRPNYFQVGVEDKRQFNENYLDILSTDVRTRAYRENGKAAGIQIQSVAPGSLAAQHGAKSGDVIKSINGNPVNSTQEAISYVKNNQGQYSTWEVVVWNSGKERTVTYNVP